MKKKVLVVDDEQSIVTLLKYNLEQAGYEVMTASDGQTALNMATTLVYDVILLDVMLPKLDGMEVCKQLRQKKNFTPIIMLTAKDDELDKILGLEFGADDYLTKPFSPREVVARVKALLRRSMISGQQEKEVNELDKAKMVVGKIEINEQKHEAFVNGEPLGLTLKEFELLAYLVKNCGKVLTREVLLSTIWNYDFAGDTRIVDVHISHLREKIETNTKKPEYIKTVRGLGYKLEEPTNE